MASPLFSPAAVAARISTAIASYACAVNTPGAVSYSSSSYALVKNSAPGPPADGAVPDDVVHVVVDFTGEVGVDETVGHDDVEFGHVAGEAGVEVAEQLDAGFREADRRPSRRRARCCHRFRRFRRFRRRCRFRRSRRNRRNRRFRRRRRPSRSSSRRLPQCPAAPAAPLSTSRRCILRVILLRHTIRVFISVSTPTNTTADRSIPTSGSITCFNCRLPASAPIVERRKKPPFIINIYHFLLPGVTGVRLARMKGQHSVWPRLSTLVRSRPSAARSPPREHRLETARSGRRRTWPAGGSTRRDPSGPASQRSPRRLLGVRALAPRSLSR